MIKLLVIVVISNVCVVRGQHGSFLGQASSQGPLCVKESNYCEESRDCCSKSCNAKKCTGGAVSEPVTITTNAPSTNILDNRFGESKPCQRSGKYCLSGEECCSGQCLLFFRKCVSSNTIQKVTTSTPTYVVTNSNGFQGQQGNQQDVGETCRQENQQCSTARSCCTFLSCEGNVCRDTAVLVEGTETFGYNPNSNNIPNRVGEDENGSNQTQVTTAPANTQCSEIGSKCYKESDCCQGLRCHGFLHQCVT